jgi:4-oxalocrotonate tautomerase
MNLMEGRSAEQKAAAAAAVTEAVVNTLGVRKEAVRVLIHELREDGFYVAGQTMAQRAAQQRAAAAEEQNS